MTNFFPLRCLKSSNIPQQIFWNFQCKHSVGISIFFDGKWHTCPRALFGIIYLKRKNKKTKRKKKGGWWLTHGPFRVAQTTPILAKGVAYPTPFGPWGRYGHIFALPFFFLVIILQRKRKIKIGAVNNFC